METNPIYKNEKFPPDLLILGKNIKYINKAFEQFTQLIKNQYNIDNYEIMFSEYEGEDYVSVTFLPNVSPTFIEVDFFEIPEEGNFKNGPGVTYFISTEDLKILKTVYMR